MSFDLTNKNIQDTFQNLLQQTGSTGEVYDLEGNQVTNININTISSSAVTASVIEIPNGDNQTGNKLHARDGDLFFGNTNLGGGGGSGLSSLVQDSTPQLGGDLDLNGNNITGSGNISAGDTTVKTLTITHHTDGSDRSAGPGNLYMLSNNVLKTDDSLHVEGGLNVDSNTLVVSRLTNKVGINLSNSQPGEALTVTGNISASGDIVGLNLSVSEITSSKVLVNAPNPTDDFFLLKSGSLNSLKVNNEGALQLGAFSFQPTAVKGGIYYDDNDDEFYAGKQN